MFLNPKKQKKNHKFTLSKSNTHSCDALPIISAATTTNKTITTITAADTRQEHQLTLCPFNRTRYF